MTGRDWPTGLWWWRTEIRSGRGAVTYPPGGCTERISRMQRDAILAELPYLDAIAVRWDGGTRLLTVR